MREIAKNLVGKLSKYKSSEYLQNIVGQAGYVLIGQLISVLFSPLLTRLYDENAMAEITGMMSLSSLVLVFSTLKLTSPIIIEKEENKSRQLVVLNLIVATIIFFLFLLIVLIFPDLFRENFKVDNILYYVPLYILLYSYMSVFASWIIRNKKFKANASSKILEAISYVALALILFWVIGKNEIGLALGKLIGVFIAGLFLYRYSNLTLIRPSWSILKEMLLKYKDFPLHNMPSSFINVISLQILVIFIGAYFTKEDLGFFGLANMIILIPVSFISQSLSSIFFQKVIESIHQKNARKTKRVFINTFALLTGISVPVFLILYFGSPYLFPFIFGENWVMTGKIASILSVVFIFQVNVSPISMILLAIDKIKLNSYWQYGRFIFMLCFMFILIYVFKVDFLEFITWYSYGVAVCYAAYFIIIYRSVMKLDNNQLS